MRTSNRSASSTPEDSSSSRFSTSPCSSSKSRRIARATSSLRTRGDERAVGPRGLEGDALAGQRAAGLLGRQPLAREVLERVELAEGPQRLHELELEAVVGAEARRGCRARPGRRRTSPRASGARPVPRLTSAFGRTRWARALRTPSPARSTSWPPARSRWLSATARSTVSRRFRRTVPARGAGRRRRRGQGQREEGRDRAAELHSHPCRRYHSSVAATPSASATRGR